MQNDIPAGVSCDPVRRLNDRVIEIAIFLVFVVPRRRCSFVDFLGDLRDGIGKRISRVPDRQGRVSLFQGVVNRLDNFCFRGDSELLEADRHRVAELHSFERGEILIFRRVPYLQQRNRYIHSRRRELVRCDIRLRLRADFRFGDILSVLELIRQIEDQRLAVSDIARRRERDHVFGQFHRFFVLIDDLSGVVVCVDRFYRERADVRIYRLDILLLLRVRQVLAVIQRHAVVRASVDVQLDDEIIEFELSCVFAQYRAFLSSYERAQGTRGIDFDIFKDRFIAPSREAVSDRTSRESRRHSRRRCCVRQG